MTPLPPFLTDDGQDSIIRTESILRIARGQDDENAPYIVFTSIADGEVATLWHYRTENDRDVAFDRIVRMLGGNSSDA